jgi:energy-coupling factor transporter transmembrane protein EcfT
MGPGILAAVDPRAKLAAFLAVQALLFLPSKEPPWGRLAALALLLLSLLMLAGRSWRLWLRLLALSAPLLAFLALSAFFRSGSGAGGAASGQVGLLIAAKAALALLSLAILILGQEPGRLLQGLRQAGLPGSAVVVLAVGLRFAGQWRLELEGMRRSWVGRNLASLPWPRRALMAGKALPVFFEKLLDSGVHVHDAMVGRGFHGALPGWRRLAFKGRDAAFLALTALAVALIATAT